MYQPKTVLYKLKRARNFQLRICASFYNYLLLVNKTLHLRAPFINISLL